MSQTKILLSLAVLAGITMFTASGCYYDTVQELYPNNTQNCDTTNVTYAADIQPILKNQCLSCHSAAAKLGNINLDGYDQLKTYVDNGKLMGTITYASGYVPMPQGGAKLSECNLNKISAWINKGALNN